MSEKYKILRSAEKYVVSGKFAQAIKEYQKLLNKEPDEPTLLNTVGDLYLKQNNREQALEQFRRAAEVYLRNGFLVKAIAVYKKIYQFDPSEPRVNESLADLYQRQGLTYEASRHLQVLIQQHQENGNLEQASIYLQRLIEIDPSDAEIQSELAQILEMRRDEGGAFQRYQAAAELFLQRDDAEKALESAKKALDFDPTDDRTVDLYVTAAVKCGQRDAAKDVLVELVSKTGQRLPYEIFLARMMEEEGDFKGAHAKYLELEPLAFTDARIREGLARTAPIAPTSETTEGAPTQSSQDEIELIFDEPRPKLHEARSSGKPDWLQLSETQQTGLTEETGAPGGFGIEGRETQPFPPPPSSSVFQPPPLEKAPSDFLWQPPEPAAPAEEEEEEAFEPIEEGEQPFVQETPIESLDEALQEADFYLKLGFREEAKKLLERLLHSYPRDERVRRRAEKVMTIPPEFDVAAEPVELFPTEEAPEKKPATKLRPARPAPGKPLEPPAPAAPPAGGPQEVPFDLASFEQSLQETATPAPLFGEEATEEAPSAAWEADEEVPTLDLDSEAQEAAQPAAEPEAPADAGAVSEEEEEPVFTLDLTESGETEPDVFEIVEEEGEVPPPATPPVEEPKGKRSAFLSRLAELEMAMTQAEAAKEAEKGQKVKEPEAPEAAAPPPSPPAAQPTPPPVTKPKPVPPPAAKPARPPAPPAVAPAATPEAPDLIPMEDLDEAPVAKEEMSEPQFDVEVDSALDVLFSGDSYEDAPAVEEVLRYDVAATGGTEETSNPKVHYDLGLAYKEMGLIEDAVQEFQMAVQLLNNPMYNPQRILCCSMLANSLLQLGRCQEASHWAAEGLKIPGKKEFEWKALKYDWAAALERQGKRKDALEGFREILDRDPEYRDVLQRVDNLLRLHDQ
jgi:pilus assembly protein FimV